MHKNIHCGAHGRLLVMGLELAESGRVALSFFGVLKVKEDLDKQIKMEKKNCVHWNVAPDAPPGSVTIGPLA